MDDEDKAAAQITRAQLDAMASLLLALTVTVCRANPRAFAKIEEMARHHNGHHARRAQADGLASQAQTMTEQLEILLASVRQTLANDARKG